VTHSSNRRFFQHNQRPISEVELRMRDTLGGLRELMLAECHARHYPDLEILDISPEVPTEPTQHEESDIEAAS